MTNGGSTGETISLSPEALINDGLRTLDSVLPHSQRRDTTETEESTETITQARTAEGDQADGFVVHEDTHAVSAIERARSFIRSNGRKIGAVGVMGIASLAPASAANADAFYDFTQPGASAEQTPASNSEQIPGTDDYPYRSKPKDTTDGDKWGYMYRGCQSYAAWKLDQRGVSIKRFENLGRAKEWIKGAQDRGEVVDNSPTPGSIIVKPYVSEGGHVAFVEDVKEDFIIYSDYNSYSDRGYSRVRMPKSEIQSGGYKFIHFELPAPSKTSESSPLTEAQRVKANKIDAKTTLESNTYIQSKNKQYSVLLDKKGNLVAYDKKSGYSKVWESKTSGKGGNTVQVKRSRSNNSLVIAKGHKKVKSWNIGKATKVAIGNDGTLAGYKGSKRVWVADELAAVTRAAKQSMSKISSVRQKALGR